MEGDGLCLDLAFLDVDLVATEGDGDVLTHTGEVTWGGRLAIGGAMDSEDGKE